MRVALSIGGVIACFALTACGGDDAATGTPTSRATSPTPTELSPSATTEAPSNSYLGAVVGEYRTVNGATYITGTGVYYSVHGAQSNEPLGRVLFAIGRITPVPNVHLIEATSLVTVPDGGTVSCNGVLVKRDGRYFVESEAGAGCGSIELIEGDAAKLDAQVGQATGIFVGTCTVTKERADGGSRRRWRRSCLSVRAEPIAG
jgi:hypothetical protein